MENVLLVFGNLWKSKQAFNCHKRGKNAIPELQSITTYLLPHLGKTGNHNTPPHPSNTTTISSISLIYHRADRKMFPLWNCCLIADFNLQAICQSLETTLRSRRELKLQHKWAINSFHPVCSQPLWASVVSGPDTRVKWNHCQGRVSCGT